MGKKKRTSKGRRRPCLSGTNGVESFILGKDSIKLYIERQALNTMRQGMKKSFPNIANRLKYIKALLSDVDNWGLAEHS
jgi:hypothetical protein